MGVFLYKVDIFKFADGYEILGVSFVYFINKFLGK